PAESPAVNLTVYGSGYSSSGTIRADGTSLTTQYISESELHGVVPSELLTTPRTISIDVMNSDSGMSSNAMLFTVTSNRTWIITATSSPNGTITPSGLVEVSEGGEKTFTMTPNTGYAVKDVLVDGDSIGPASAYTFTNVVSNRTIHAEFANLSGQHAINAIADDWTINYPSGQKIYPTGTNQTQITQAKPGADLSDVKVDNTSQGSVPSYTFTHINTSHEITTEGDATPGQVHVRFDGSPVSGKAPMIVQFEDKSLGYPSSWYWNFGDGTNSTDQHPAHIFRYPGSYTVSLRAYNNETGGNLLKNSYITVLE
ncbi:MAG: PKD domain-containing protein, partial [Methanomicrobiales archaeon]|nr:PKD domain-containing protein [Methanomicrobiales archaeon]